MKNSKELMKQAGILPKLRLGTKTERGVVSTGPHRVRVLEDNLKNGINADTGKEEPQVHYVVEENGEKKEYVVSVKNKQGQLHYLVQRLAEVPDGGEVILEMKKRGIKNYVEVIPVGDVESVEYDDEGEDDGAADVPDDVEAKLDEDDKSDDVTS